MERFNNTLRQRVSRLVRETLSFSKKLENHTGAIKYYLCYHNLNHRMDGIDRSISVALPKLFIKTYFGLFIF